MVLRPDQRDARAIKSFEADEERKRQLEDKRQTALSRAALQLAIALDGNEFTLDERYGSEASVEQIEEGLFPEERRHLVQARVIIDSVMNALELDESIKRIGNR